MPSSDALGEIGTALLGEVAERLAQIDGDLSPERAAVRLKALGDALSILPAHDLLLATAAVALAALGAIDRRIREGRPPGAPASYPHAC